MLKKNLPDLKNLPFLKISLFFKISHFLKILFNPFFFALFYRIFKCPKCPTVSLPEVPPKWTCYAKITLDIVTGIVLPLTDEVTDLISGVHWSNQWCQIFFVSLLFISKETFMWRHYVKLSLGRDKIALGRDFTTVESAARWQPLSNFFAGLFAYSKFKKFESLRNLKI